MGKALYRAYRSRTLDEIVGQPHITKLLRNAIDKGRISHAYLLTGPKGTGKTSIARIIAHEINQFPYSDDSSHLDIIEIDAASHTSVEDIRDLREKIMIAPSSAAYKVYIIDEIHMLSKSAFNALLKTLEEPPAHVVFILATTDVEKLPATILSRVQRLNFRLIPSTAIVSHLAAIAKKEKISINKDALELIAHHGQGSFRDAISLLDQMRNMTDGTITASAVEEMLGMTSRDTILQLIDFYRSGDTANIISLLDTIEQSGASLTVVINQLILFLRSTVASSLDLLPLLDRLAAIGNTPWQHIKLLAALTHNAPRPPRPIEAQHIEEPVNTSPPPPSPPDSAPIKKDSVSVSKQPTSSVSLDWQHYLEQIRSSNPGIAGLLTKLGHDLNGSTLTIYAGKSFTKSRLEKSLPLLTSTFATIAHDENAEVVVTTESKPPSDSQTAALIAMMGGGEEVDPDA